VAWTLSFQYGLYGKDLSLQAFSLGQMSEVELVQTLPWRENALFEERGKNPMARRLAQFVKLLLGIRSCLVRNL